jgi:hypothetical protein
MEQGHHFFRRGQFLQAAAAYRAGHAVLQSPTSGIELARAEAAAGQWLLACATARAVADIPRAPDEPEHYQLAREDAAWMVRNLAPRLPTLKLWIEGAPLGANADVTVDGEQLRLSTVLVPRKLDPGVHQIVVRVEGFAPERLEVSLAASQRETVRIRLRRVGTSPFASSENGPAISEWAYLGVGIGAVGLVAGSLAGILSVARANAAEDHCASGGRCGAEAAADVSAARTLATVSNVGFLVGLSGTALGVGVLASDLGWFSSERRRVQPLVGWRRIGVRGSF